MMCPLFLYFEQVVAGHRVRKYEKDGLRAARSVDIYYVDGNVKGKYVFVFFDHDTKTHRMH